MRYNTFKTALQNLRRNWYLPISIMAFFWLSAAVTPGYFVLSLMISLAVASQAPSLRDCLQKGKLLLQLFCVLSALGICWGAYVDWNTSAREGQMQAMLPLSPGMLDLISVACTALSVVFVYVCLICFWTRLLATFAELGTFRGLDRRELLVYVLLFLLVCFLVAAVFLRTDMVYGTEYDFDNLYTSDSSALVKGNVYLALTHMENDIRQPLFAVFAAPFMGLPNLVAELLSASTPVRAVILNTAQLGLLFLATFLLARAMELSPGKRVCFVLMVCSTYTYLLFELMMEQYVVAYFWLVFFLYQVCENRQPSRLALWGTGGTLLTGMILLPFMSEKHPLKAFKGWFMDMVRYGLEFVAVLFVFFRYDVLFHLTEQAAGIGGYTGSHITLYQKFCQYTHFVRNCFAAPLAGVDFGMVDHVSWKMAVVTDIHPIGVLIFLAAVISAVLNRKKRSSVLAMAWALFSVVLLMVMGWGTTENGLLLYALYFGWTFFVLLFQLVEWLAERLGANWLVPAVSIGGAAVLLALNLPSIMEMVNFGITYYPV